MDKKNQLKLDFTSSNSDSKESKPIAQEAITKPQAKVISLNSRAAIYERIISRTN